MARTLKDAAEEFFVRKIIEGGIKRLKGVSPMLTGFKTYIVAALLIALAAASSLGWQVPGFDVAPGEAITMALGLIFARNGAKTEVKKAAGN